MLLQFVDFLPGARSETPLFGQVFRRGGYFIIISGDAETILKK